MAASSRWMARVVGRWQLQPIWPKRRQTWSGWYLTPKRSSMSLATRWAVQSSVANPCVVGFCWRALFNSWMFSGVSRDGRPARGAFFSALGPPRRQAAYQRVADWQETVHWRATSAGAQPLSNKRRRCNSSKSRFCPFGKPISNRTCESRGYSLYYAALNSCRSAFIGIGCDAC